MAYGQRDNMVEAAYDRKATPHYIALAKIKVKPVGHFRKGHLTVMRGSKHKMAPARALRLLGRLKMEKSYGDEVY